MACSEKRLNFPPSYARGTSNFAGTWQQNPLLSRLFAKFGFLRSKSGQFLRHQNWQDAQKPGAKAYLHHLHHSYKKNVGKSKNIGAGVLHITVMAIRNHKICMYISSITVPSILINLQYYVKLFPFRRLLCKNTTARFQMASVLYLFMTREFFSPLLIILTCNIPLGKLKNCTEHSDLALK